MTEHATRHASARSPEAPPGRSAEESPERSSERSPDPASDGSPTWPPDDPRKPSAPTDLRKPSWKYVARRTVREFSSDRCTDLAAALTYYAVLSLFPALVALVSLPAVVGQGQQTTDALMGVVDDLMPASVAGDVRGPIEQLTAAPAAGVALIIGLAVALWSASNYVNAFSRAMNVIYEVEEGRPFWKLRPLMLLITLVTMALVLAAAVLLVVSGPVARAVGDALGLGDVAVTAWNIAKWPLLAVVVVMIVALLYYATPNVKQPKFRWISMGAFIAIVVWALGSAGFALYVVNFSNYDRMYGSLGGVIVFLLWLWLTNLALLFGAEFDAETERARQLQAGMAAEEQIQLPPRDTRQIEKSAAKEAKLVRLARRLRTGRPNRRA